jgi:hypothetical protein
MVRVKSTENVGAIDYLLPDIEGKEEAVGGSKNFYFDYWLLGQVCHCLWRAPSDAAEDRQRKLRTAIAAMIGIRPGDEIEGMIAAQIVATYNAAMECFQRAVQEDQTFEGWRECLNQANKLTRSGATLVEALHRHRGQRLAAIHG